MSSATALRPRSVTEIVDAAFQVLKAHYGQFVMCSAIAYVPWLIAEIVWLRPRTTIAPAAALWTSLGTFFGIWLSFSLMSAVIIVCVSQAYLGDPVEVDAAVKRVLPRMHRILIAAALRYVLLIIGFLAFIVGSLYVVARFFALTPVVVLEDSSVFHAFGRTSDLSRGRKWHILNTIGLVGIIYWMLNVGVGVVALLTHSFVAQVLISAIFTILAYPVIAITEALLYYDARIRSEGLDIELMTDALAGASPEAASP